MSDRASVPARMRRISAELRRLRRERELSAEFVAGALGFSMPKLSRLENAQRGLNPDDVSALLGLYQVPAPRRDEILAAVREGGERNWWGILGAGLPKRDELMCFEAETSSIHCYEPMLIPGLLQAADYTEALLRGLKPTIDPASVQDIVDSRAQRQRILIGPDAPHCEFVIDQAVLERVIGGPGTMERQWWQILASARHPRITLRVVPGGLGAHPGLVGSFTLLAFERHSPVVFMENRVMSAFLEEPAAVAEIRQALRRLRGLALSPEDSLRLVHEAAGRVAGFEGREGERARTHPMAEEFF